MRHRKHKYSLGRVKEHRESLMTNLAAALFRHGKIETTLTKAKALRPFSEKLITMAKKAHLSSDMAEKLHYRRTVIARVRDEDAVTKLFNERAHEFVKRNGGYTRIYKLSQRIGDAADMAIIELISADDVGYSKSKKRRTSKSKKSQSSISRGKRKPVEKTSDTANHVVDNDADVVLEVETTVQQPTSQTDSPATAKKETSKRTGGKSATARKSKKSEVEEK